MCVLFSCKKDPPIYPEPATDPVVVVEPPDIPDPNSFPGTYLLFDADMDFNSLKTSAVEYTSIYYSRLNGSQITRITNPPAPYNDYRASISPDGKKIIFTRYKKDKTDSYICTVDLDGSDLKPIVKIAGADCASFSPDGTQIVYARPSKPNAGHDIYIAKADGSEEKRLTTFGDYPGGDCDIPRWSVDGKIYFNTFVTSELNAFFSVTPDGAELNVITSSIIRFLAVSPDGKLALSGHDFNLFISNMDGTEIKSLTNYTGNMPYPFMGAGFTIDQKQVYIASYNKSSDQLGIYRVGIDGKNLRLIKFGYYEYPSVF
jgi:Tol biopolymer transport system component